MSNESVLFLIHVRPVKTAVFYAVARVFVEYQSVHIT